MARLKFGLCLFVPFAAAYFVSYLFRVINAVVAGPLVDEFDLNAAQLGVLTSIYFLTFAAVQLPAGVAIDRFGPSRVQGVLLTIAAIGALVFATASGIAGLLIGRGLIGLGVAAALIAGLKAIADEFPQERLPLLNGAFVAFGAAGAVTATAPLEWLLARLDWRSVFVLLSVLTMFVALLFPLVVRQPCRREAPTRSAFLDVQRIYIDPRFWRLAPISALCIGTAWAFQGLWVAPWLADVILLGRAGIVQHLHHGGVVVCRSAAHRHRIPSSKKPWHRACILVWGCRVGLHRSRAGSCLPGSLTQRGNLRSARSHGRSHRPQLCAIDRPLPPRCSGPCQCCPQHPPHWCGFRSPDLHRPIVGLWERDGGGHYPAHAYQIAFFTIAILQLAALIWFLRPFPLAHQWIAPPRRSADRP